MRKLIVSILAVAVCLSVSSTGFSNEGRGYSGLGTIGRKIYANECGSNPENLITWNRGEDFISLGIGHFIWYPQGKSGPYSESFLTFLSFAIHQKAKLPEMLAGTGEPGCPWPDRASYLEAKDSAGARVLRSFLVDTIPLQTRFLLIRLDRALPHLLQATPRQKRPEIEKKFYQVARTAHGRYALADYVNFKGEGIFPTERIDGVGWGLLQVLEDMDPRKSLVNANEEFAAAAERILIRRANADPRPYVKENWLPGWARRVRTYAEP